MDTLGKTYSFLHFPVEIQLGVISYAQHSSLRNLGATCKHLQFLTDPLVYSNAEIGLRPEECIPKGCLHLIQPMTKRDYQRLRYVKQIKFKLISGSKDGQDSTTDRSNLIQIKNIKRAQDILSSQGLDWSRSMDIRPRWVDAIVLAVLSNISKGKLEGFIWNLDTKPDESIFEHIIMYQPAISTLGFRMIGHNIYDTLYLQPYFATFTTLRSLDLRFNYRGWPSRAILDILAANQETLGEFSLSFSFPLNSAVDLTNSYHSWKKDNPGKIIQLAKATSVRFRSNPETLVFLRDHKLITREKVEHIDVQIHCRDITTVFTGLTERPGRGCLPNCFPDLKRLRVRLSEKMESEVLNQWGERYITYLERLIGSFDLLEELKIEGLWEKLDLWQITLPRTTLRRVELQAKSTRVFYSPAELCTWSAGFDNLKSVVIREKYAVLTRNNDGTFTRRILI